MHYNARPYERQVREINPVHLEQFGGPRSRFGRFVEEEKTLSPTEIQTSVLPTRSIIC